MDENSPTYLFNEHFEGHILDKNDFWILHSVTGGQQYSNRSLV